MDRRGKIISKKGWLYGLVLSILLILTFALTQNAAAQVNRPDSTSRFNDSVGITSPTAGDTLRKSDTTALRDTSARSTVTALEDSLGIRISPDALDEVVTAVATDSAVVDMERNLFYLYGEARVSYEDLVLEAPIVRYDQATNTITAAPLYDTSGIAGNRPTFTQGQEKLTYDSLQYNFRSKRAIIRNARSQYGEGFVASQQVKRNPDQSIYGFQSIYTTCSNDTPHFGIRARRIKVIPERIIVSGAANLEIEHVPTPIYLPFGVFPITQSQRSGFQIPSYTLEERRGLGLTRGGYYFHINDYADLNVLADIYSKGSYNLYFLSTYANRYHYTGGFNFSYSYQKTGEVYEPQSSNEKSFKIEWRHASDAKSRPGTSFNSSVNIVKNNYDQNNGFYTAQILQNQYQSNITWSKNWPGKPFNLTIAGRHDQNTQRREVNVTLPQVNFYISQFSPFQKKNRVGSAKWFEKITASYNFDALARTTFIDTNFHLSNLGLNDINMGVHHTVPINAAYTVARYINLSFSANYNEYWLTERFFRSYNSAEDRIDTVINRGFFTARDFTASMSLSTRIYGMKLFRRGSLAGIRHVLTPNASLNFIPDFAAPPFRYYYGTYLRPGGTIEYQSPFVRSVVGVPGLNQYGDFASNVSFGLNNNLQIKTRSGSDTGMTTKNITLIDALGINTAYNVAADSFKWSPLLINFRTNILNNLNISGSAVFDLYEYDYTLGREVDRTVWEAGGGIARFTSAQVALSATFRSKETPNTEKGKEAQNSDDARRILRNGGYNDYVDFKIPWTLNVSYALQVNNHFYRGGDSLSTDQFAQFSGDLNLTPKLKIGFSSGYNITRKEVSITSIDLYRDLHCWEMRLHLIPFGLYRQYTFTLNVKASILQDLRLLRSRNFRDAAY